MQIPTSSGSLLSANQQHPILVAIDAVAAHRDRYPFSCSNSSRTARSLTSGEYRFALFMLQSSQDSEPPKIPVRFKAAFRLNEGNCEVDTVDRMEALARGMGGRKLRYKDLIG